MKELFKKNIKKKKKNKEPCTGKHSYSGNECTQWQRPILWQIGTLWQRLYTKAKIITMAETPPLPYGKYAHYGKDLHYGKDAHYGKDRTLWQRCALRQRLHIRAKPADRQKGLCHVQEVYTGRKKDTTVSTRVVTLAKQSVALARTATLVRKGLHATQKCHTDKVIKFGRKIFHTGKSPQYTLAKTDHWHAKTDHV